MNMKPEEFYSTTSEIKSANASMNVSPEYLQTLLEYCNSTGDIYDYLSQKQTEDHSNFFKGLSFLLPFSSRIFESLLLQITPFEKYKALFITSYSIFMRELLDYSNYPSYKSRELDELVAQVSEYRKEIILAENIKLERSLEKVKLSKNLEILNKNNKNLESEILSLKNKTEELNTNHSLYTESLKEYKQKLPLLEVEISKISGEKKDLEGKYNLALKTSEEMKASLNELRTTLSNFQQTNQSITQEKSALEIEIERMKVEIQRNKESLKELQEKRKKFSEEESMIKRLSQELGALKNQMPKVEKLLSEAERIHSELRTFVNPEDRSSDILG